jgi:hypothetical protein
MPLACAYAVVRDVGSLDLAILFAFLKVYVRLEEVRFELRRLWVLLLFLFCAHLFGFVSARVETLALHPL